MLLTKGQEFYIRQRKELVEIIGYESRNKYEIRNQDQELVAYAAEQGKGFLGAIVRQILGHWRTFEIQFFDPQGQKLFVAKHPFRWFFSRLEIYSLDGQLIGALQKRFSILTKKFDLEDEYQKVQLTVASPFWRIWTFPFKNHSGKEMVRIEKKWSGLLKEAFTDADNFKVTFQHGNWNDNQRKVIIASGIFIDLLYFEKKAGNN